MELTGVVAGFRGGAETGDFRGGMGVELSVVVLAEFVPTKGLLAGLGVAGAGDRRADGSHGGGRGTPVAGHGAAFLAAGVVLVPLVPVEGQAFLAFGRRRGRSRDSAVAGAVGGVARVAAAVSRRRLRGCARAALEDGRLLLVLDDLRSVDVALFDRHRVDRRWRQRRRRRFGLFDRSRRRNRRGHLNRHRQWRWLCGLGFRLRRKNNVQPNPGDDAFS